MSIDPLLVQRFEGEYKQTAGFSSYEDKNDILQESIKLGETLRSSQPNHNDTSNGHDEHPPLPGPRPVTVTSFKELRDMKLHSVVPKFGPSEIYHAPMLASQEVGWRAAEAKPSAAVLQFTKILSGKA